jgi:hypothetical protein
LKQQISLIGQKRSEETLGGHWTPLNLGMSRSAVGNAFNFQAAQDATGEKEIRDALDKLKHEPVTGS